MHVAHEMQKEFESKQALLGVRSRRLKLSGELRGLVNNAGRLVAYRCQGAGWKRLSPKAGRGHIRVTNLQVNEMPAFGSSQWSFL
jgi:hypothetical protein